MVDPYDVIVVGAGPAGSMSARTTVKSGFRTLLIDRRNIIGIPVQCGELIPTPKEAKNLFPSSKRMPRAVHIPRKFITNRTSTIRLISPSGSFFEFPFAANIVNRHALDQYLVHQAEDAGAEVRLGTWLNHRSAENTLSLRSKGDEYNEEAKIVIGADGSRSKVAQSLGAEYIHPERDLSPSLQYVMENADVDSSVVEMHFGSVAPGGYAWCIPKGDGMVNIGFGLRRELVRNERPLRAYLDRFAFNNRHVSRFLKNAKILSTVGAIIPVGGPLRKTWSTNVLLVGDAAGHVMASNGGGIPTALCGGLIAGETVAHHLERDSSLENYENVWQSEFGTELNTALRVLRIADTVMPSDTVTDICMRLAGVRFLEPLIRCKLPPLVDLASKTLVEILNRVI